MVLQRAFCSPYSPCGSPSALARLQVVAPPVYGPELVRRPGAVGGGLVGAQVRGDLELLDEHVAETAWRKVGAIEVALYFRVFRNGET